MSGKYFDIGFETGYDIARTNIHELTQENQEEFASNMAETESDIYRQFSPFEFLAKEINEWEDKWNRHGDLWEKYDNGVSAGINKAIAERLAELESENE